MKINSHKVRLIMADAGMTQSMLAEKCGIARQNICNILSKGRCTPISAGRLAAALGVPTSDIVLED